MSDIFRCTKETPWTPDKGNRAAHDRVIEVADYGDTRRVRCNNCGHEWTEELPQ